MSFLAPSQCRLCREHMLLQAKAAPVCGDCLAQLQDVRLGVCCSLCSEPLGYEASLHAPDQLCARCDEARPVFVRATAFGAYEPLGPALRLFKFDGVRALEAPLGEMLAEAILAQSEGMPEQLLVVPVPLFGRRRRLYNQSELLARGAVRAVRRLHPEWGMELAPHGMTRVHHNEAHYRLSPEERRENVRGAFRVQRDVRDRDVLLVDDVYTTGATVAECTETLLAAGARSVRVVTLARAGMQMATRWTPRSSVQPLNGVNAPALTPPDQRNRSKRDAVRHDEQIDITSFARSSARDAFRQSPQAKVARQVPHTDAARS